MQMPGSNAMRRWTVVVFAALLGSALALPAQAQWKWRDRSGQTQYSDLPPPNGTPEQDILQRPSTTAAQRRAAAASAPASSASDAARLAPKAVEPELEAKRKKAEQEAADKKKAEAARAAAADADNCLRAKAQLRSIESGARMARTNEKGEQEVIDDAARAAEARHTRDVIAASCK